MPWPSQHRDKRMCIEASLRSAVCGHIVVAPTNHDRGWTTSAHSSQASLMPATKRVQKRLRHDAAAHGNRERSATPLGLLRPIEFGLVIARTFDTISQCFDDTERVPPESIFRLDARIQPQRRAPDCSSEGESRRDPVIRQRIIPSRDTAAAPGFR